MSEYRPRQAELISSERLTDGFAKIDRLVLRHELYRGGFGLPIQREMLMRGPAVGLILYDPVADACVMIEQFRSGPWVAGREPWMLEIVAGMIEPGEPPEDVVRREAIEEAGITVGAVEFLFDYFVSPGSTTEYLALYLGRADVTTVGGVHGLAEEGEDIKVVVITVDDLRQQLEAGALGNATSIIAMQWLLLHRDDIRARWLA